ncbi:hypothetical protein J437_LFUL018366 [Ladona fulva]|uniref:C2H2-type domain-containing protein n=1 Tax=Ladona fulva TaxID=123851 RepID=A0A8K0KSV8_LADFU|nr:hypothetical protein J437_LFUL018366 [Ladona fulva]
MDIENFSEVSGGEGNDGGFVEAEVLERKMDVVGEVQELDQSYDADERERVPFERELHFGEDNSNVLNELESSGVTYDVPEEKRLQYMGVKEGSMDNLSVEEASSIVSTPVEPGFSGAKIPAQNRRKDFVCDVCHKSFQWKRDLYRHTTVHTNDRPHSCNICGKRFKLKRDRRLHELRHIRDENNKSNNEIENIEKPYPCYICGKQFYTGKKLSEHFNIHTNKYSCNFCGKSYRNSSDLSRHKRIHSKVKGFSCEICQKSFYQSCNLKSHMKSHSLEKTFSCNFCGKKFKLKNCKRQH